MMRRNRLLLICAVFAAPLVLVGCSGKDDSGVDAPVGVKGNGPPPPPPNKAATPKPGAGS